MTTYKSNYKAKSFKQRLSEGKIWSIKFSIILTIGAFLFMLLKRGFSIFDDFAFRAVLLLGYFFLFYFSLLLFNYYYNRFLILKLSIDKTHFYIEYEEKGKERKMKLPLKKTEIKLVQWYHTNNIYLKICTDETAIKQYANNGWSVERLREVFTALKESQERLTNQKS